MTDETFTGREAHLISLAASVAAGCLPCAAYYIEHANQAACAGEELRAAIAVAESVRTRAAEDCALRARRRLGDPVEEPAAFPLPPRELDTLLSVASAYAVNSHALLGQLLDAARAANVPAGKVREAIQIARGVRSMAIAIVDRRIEREADLGGSDTSEPASCSCG